MTKLQQTQTVQEARITTDTELIKLYCLANNLPKTSYGKLPVAPEYTMAAMRYCLQLNQAQLNQAQLNQGV